MYANVRTIASLFYALPRAAASLIFFLPLVGNCLYLAPGHEVLQRTQQSYQQLSVRAPMAMMALSPFDEGSKGRS